MRAWSVERPAPIDDHPLALTERPEPVPAPDEILVRVRVCGHAVTTSTTQSSSAATASAQARAKTLPEEPSTPTTIVPVTAGLPGVRA